MEHFYKDIPGWAAFAGLYFDQVQRAPQSGSHFIEVGSWLGRSAALMAVEIINSGKQIRFDCVDPWIDGGPDLCDADYFDPVLPLYDRFLNNIRPVMKNINRIMKMRSVDAVRYYPDQSLDFVMLDGDHSYEAVQADIAVWMPKMKRGGLLAGDDYFWPGVRRAVNEAIHDKKFKSTVAVKSIKQDADYKLSAAYWSVRVV